MRFMVSPADGTVITLNGPNASNLALSPNGRYLAYVADQNGRERTLWVKALDSLTAQRLDRTEGASFPFWSPDSQHIGFFANGKLMRISIAGGAPLTICDAPNADGGTWSQPDGQDGTIVFAPDLTGPLQRVNAQGGVPKNATTLRAGENSHSFPQFLPGGRRFLFLARGDKPGIAVQTLDSDERTFVLDTIGRAMYSPPGFLLFLRDNTLLAQHFDPETLHLDGEPVSIAEGVRSGGNNGRNAFVVSNNGVLAYRGGGSLQTHLRLVQPRRKSRRRGPAARRVRRDGVVSRQQPCGRDSGNRSGPRLVGKGSRQRCVLASHLGIRT
jgi:serine/threonine-protein kinase